ncbi:MAG: hypothetical protein AAB840_00085 [Patescibacteria group bacterium]
MKLALLHGPAISSSRKKLIEIKQKFDTNNVVTFEKGVEIADILASLQTVSMFDEEKLIIAENPSEDFTVDYTLYPNPYTLILWYDHEIKKAPDGAQVLFFPEAREISVFPFLDNLGNKDKKAFVEFDKLKKAGFDTQYMVTMIFYLLRTLCCTPKSSPEFVKKKIASQKHNFSEDELVNLYKYVIETDFKIKSGLMEPAQAEFLLVNMFTHYT